MPDRSYFRGQPRPLPTESRSELLSYLYGGALPSTVPSTIERNASWAPVPNGVDHVDKYTITNTGGRGGVAYAWWLVPTAQENGRILVWHCGHWSAFNLYAPSVLLIENALARGYCVLCLEMPLYGNQPGGDTAGGVLTLTVGGVATDFTHQQGAGLHPFEALGTDGGPPGPRVYHDPICVAINQAVLERPTYPLYYVGHSGGGVLMDMQAAFDMRCRVRYGIFAALPPQWNAQDNTNDWEQEASYPLNYHCGDWMRRCGLATLPGPRRAVQVYSDGDNEFSTAGLHPQLTEFQGWVRGWSGNDRYSIAYVSATSHNFGQPVVDFVLDDINSNP